MSERNRNRVDVIIIVISTVLKRIVKKLSNKREKYANQYSARVGPLSPFRSYPESGSGLLQLTLQRITIGLRAPKDRAGYIYNNYISHEVINRNDVLFILCKYYIYVFLIYIIIIIFNFYYFIYFFNFKTYIIIAYFM
jgi:hypothetical protein